MRELEKLLSNSGDGRVIWTSSITAYNKSFNIDDWQGIKRYFFHLYIYTIHF
jgi:17beta-estradiol 17-dehydrogenase/3beta-hydroxysteroid 3-dehydrogenase